MPIKPLSFKGDKKVKKRKHRETTNNNDAEDNNNSSHALTTTQAQGQSGTGESVEEDDDTWTTPDNASDLSGPLVLVLPTIPATCLASDMHGNVFASPLENVIDGRAETAEPHDVRQVWVVTQVASGSVATSTSGGNGGGGVGGNAIFSFKASHGGYLSCDALGVLGATREARGVEEGFVVEKIEDDDKAHGAVGQTSTTTGVRWRVKMAASSKEKPKDDGSATGGHRYICAVVATNNNNNNNNTTQGTTSSSSHAHAKEDDDDDEEHHPTTAPKKKNVVVSISLRGDGEANSESTHLILKMQARFLPRLQQSKETKAKAKISRRELEQAVGRRLEDDEVKRLKKARREGTYHEEILDVRVKGKHDKFAS